MGGLFLDVSIYRGVYLVTYVATFYTQKIKKSRTE